MPADPLLAALDDALECPQLGHLSRGDRLALALWWLIESVADELEMTPERAADEVAMLCELAKEMMEDLAKRIAEAHVVSVTQIAFLFCALY